MADVFISYAHEDRDAVRELAHRLTKAGFSAWWDREIAVGARLARVIEDELEKARAVIVVWSAASVESTWVIGEADFGLEAGKLIPVQIDDARIPLPFRVCGTADMRGWPTEYSELQIQKLMLSVQAQVSGEAIDEEHARASNDRLDPTVSVRIAKRVTQALQQHEPTAKTAALELRLNLEMALTEFALDILSEAPGQQALAGFFGKLEPLLRTSYINVWDESAQIYGWDSRGRELADSLGRQRSLLLSETCEDASAPDWLNSNGLRWAFVARHQGVTVAIGSMYSDSPDPQVLERLEMACDLVARHLSRSSERSTRSADG